MSGEQDQSAGAAQLAKLLVDLQGLMEPVMEAAIGYRQRMIDAGVSKEAADKMAVTYHDWLMSIVSSGFGKGSYGLGKPR